MPRNGSGIYTLPAGNPVVSGTPIEASWANPTLEDMGQALTESLPRTGVAPMSANLPMGGFKAVNMGEGTAGTDGATVSQIAGALNDFLPGLTPAAPLVSDNLAFSRGAATYQASISEVLALAGEAVVPPSTETTNGITRIANLAEVFAGIDDFAYVTSQKLRQWGQGFYKALQVATTKILAYTDVGQYIYNTGSGALTITTPSSADGSIPFGSRIDFFQAGTGSITFAAGAGVTIIKSNSVLRQYKAATMVRINATTWHLIGGVTA